MGQYARVVVKYKDRDGLESQPDGLELHQNYDAFAVLAGARNDHFIAPMFPLRDEHPLVTEACAVPLDDFWDWMSSHSNRDQARYELFGDYSPRTWFMLEELEAFDFDQPLAFLPERQPLNPTERYRSGDLQEGDTYRSFIERETGLFEWFDQLKQHDVELVIVAFD